MSHLALRPSAAASLVISALFTTPLSAQPTPLASDPVSFRDVVKKVAPAVVSIEAKSAVKPAVRSMSKLPPGVPEEHRRFFERPNEPVDPNLGFGSGVLIDSTGVVLTNFHVVEGADAVEVTLPDGRSFPSKDIRRDPKTDLAVIKLASAKPLPFLELGDSDAMEVGDRVLAVGAPFGLMGSVTHGIVSAKSRQGLNLNQYEDFLQTDAALNPGNSGGPLVNLAGQVVGITAAIKTKSGGFQGVGLAVSSNLARDVAKQLLTTGVVRRGHLGVSVRDLDDDTAARVGVAKGTGVVVTQVYADSPGAKAGLRAGDVITTVAGVPVKEAGTLPRVIGRLPLGRATEIGYVRDRKTEMVRITVEEQPANAAGPLVAAVPQPGGVVLDGLGFAVADLTPQTAAQFGHRADVRGIVVTDVDRGGRAAQAGLVRGVLVLKVDRTPVVTAKEFAVALAAANPDRGALLYLQRPSGEVDFVVLRVK